MAVCQGWDAPCQSNTEYKCRLSLTFMVQVRVRYSAGSSTSVIQHPEIWARGVRHGSSSGNLTAWVSWKTLLSQKHEIFKSSADASVKLMSAHHDWILQSQYSEFWRPEYSQLKSRTSWLPYADVACTIHWQGQSRYGNPLAVPHNSDWYIITSQTQRKTLTSSLLHWQVKGSGDMAFVATGDIDDMWIRDSAVQLSIYFPRISGRPALRRVIEGAIRAQAFYILQAKSQIALSSLLVAQLLIHMVLPKNLPIFQGQNTIMPALGPHILCETRLVGLQRKLVRPFSGSVSNVALNRVQENVVQDPYANAYTHTWRERDAWSPLHRRIGRGGWVATRNYELDSGAYFINMLWNYYTTPGLFATERWTLWPWTCIPLIIRLIQMSCSPGVVLICRGLQHFKGYTVDCNDFAKWIRPSMPMSHHDMLYWWRGQDRTQALSCRTGGMSQGVIRICCLHYTRFLNETMIVDAVALMVRTWQTEQHHERDSDYRYSELPRNGKGPKSNYTGTYWSIWLTLPAEWRAPCHTLYSNSVCPEKHWICSAAHQAHGGLMACRHVMERVPAEWRPAGLQLQRARQHVCSRGVGACGSVEWAHLALGQHWGARRAAGRGHSAGDWNMGSCHHGGRCKGVRIRGTRLEACTLSCMVPGCSTQIYEWRVRWWKGSGFLKFHACVKRHEYTNLQNPVHASWLSTRQLSTCAWMLVTWYKCVAQVDGMGNSLLNFDDPNVPSLLSIPLLGYAHYDPEIYAATRARILSRANAWYFEGSALRGLGSPHTPHSHVWPLAMSVQVWVHFAATTAFHRLRKL